MGSDALGAKVGTLNQVMLVTDTGFRPKVTSYAMVLQFGTNCRARISMSKTGILYLSESQGITSGSNDLYANITWIES